jgi:hypothetical protein
MVKHVTIIVILLALIGALAWRFLRPEEAKARSRAVQHRELALRVMAEYLAGQAANQQALVLSNPFSRKPGQKAEVYAFETAGVEGLKQGWGDKVRLLAVAFPELNPAYADNPAAAPIDPRSTTPLSFLTTPDAWDRLAQQHPQADLWISLIGLPLSLQSLEVWRQPKPRFALLLPDLRMIGDQAAVLEAFRRGKLAAVVLNRPGAPAEQAAPERDYRAEFERRFLLLTTENLPTVLQLYPQLF